MIKASYREASLLKTLIWLINVFIKFRIKSVPDLEMIYIINIHITTIQSTFPHAYLIIIAVT